MPRNYEKFDVGEIEDAIRGSGGIKLAVCAKLRCARNTLEAYLEKYPELSERLKEAREEFKDVVESKIVKLVKEDNLTAIIFAAKTLCRDRGYVERREINEIDPPQIVITQDEDDYFESPNARKAVGEKSKKKTKKTK